METRSVAAWAGACCIALAGSSVATADVADLPPEEQILELRAVADYDGAAELARDLAARQRTDPDVPAWRRGDTARLLATLDAAAALPTPAQQKLAEVDRPEPPREGATLSRAAVDQAVKDRERQLAVRRVHLGPAQVEVADSLVALAREVERAGDIPRAEALLREALALRRQLLEPDHPDLADLLDALVRHLLMQGASDELDLMAREAFEMRQRLYGDPHPAVARSLFTLGELARRKADWREATRLISTALAMQREALGNDHLDVAESLMSLAALSSGIDFAASERRLREALAIRRRIVGEDHVLVVATLGKLAEHVRWQGDPLEAKRILENVLAIERRIHGEDHPTLATTLNNLAMAYWHLKDYEPAVPLLERSADIFRESLGWTHPYTLTVRSNLGKAHAYTGRFDEATAILDSALEDARERGKTQEARQSINVIIGYQSKVAELQGDLARAERLARQTLEWTLAHGEATAGAAGAYEGIGALRAAAGDLETAEVYFAKSADSWESARLRGGAGIKAATFKTTPYEYLALTHLERGHAEKAWPAVERARARVLADQLIPGSEEELPFRLERVQATLAESEAIVGWLDFHLYERMPRSWGYVIRHTGPPHWVRLSLGPDDRDVEALAQRLQTFRERIAATASPLGRRSPVAARAAGTALWAERFEPLLPHLDGVSQLVVIPSWAMGSFPLDALVDGEDRWVGDRYGITYAPSATLHAWLRESRRENAAAPRSALLVGDPPFRDAHLVALDDANDPDGLLAAASIPAESAVLRSALRGDQRAAGLLPRLPWSRHEVAWAGRRFPDTTVLLGTEASELRLSALARSGSLAHYGVVHIATHALIDDEKPERSGLVFSQVQASGAEDPTLDGIVTGAEIIATWKLGAELVTLSACRTAHGRNVYGEGVVGLAYPFLQSGARALLVSLWPVDDRATALFMERFYDNWLDSGSAGPIRRMSKAEALRKAKRWLRDYRDDQGNRPYRHPAYWSAFILIGDGM